MKNKPYIFLALSDTALISQPETAHTSYQVRAFYDKDEIKKQLKQIKTVAVLCVDQVFFLELASFLRNDCRNKWTRILLLHQDPWPKDLDLSVFSLYDVHGLCPVSQCLEHPNFLSAFSLFQKLSLSEIQRKSLFQLLQFSVCSTQHKDIDSYLYQASKEIELFSYSFFGDEEYQIMAFFCRQNSASFDILHKDKEKLGLKLNEKSRELISLSLKDLNFIKETNISIFPYKGQNRHYALFVLSEPDLDSIRTELLSTYFRLICIGIKTIESFIEEKEEKNSEKVQSLNDLIQVKKNLLRVLYHDLNNTLTVMIPSVDLALDLAPDQIEKNKFFLGKIKKSLIIQKDIIDQVRHIDAVQSGKQNLDLKPVDLTEMVQNSFFVFKDKMREKNLNFEFDIESRSLVMAEPVSLGHTVVNNLISNAIKFSYPNGIIQISIKSIDSNWILLTVRDHGIGIPKNLIDKIFREDCKTNRAGTSGEKGTGFGMPLVKNYVDGYGGRIEVESFAEGHFPDKHGTIFYLYLKNAV